MEQLHSLSSDLLLERKRLKQSLKALEDIVVSSGLEFKLQNEILEYFQKEIFRLSSGLGRIEQIAKKISSSVQNENLVSADEVLKKIHSYIEISAKKHNKIIKYIFPNDKLFYKIKRIDNFGESISNLIDALIEFSLENERERILRRKESFATCHIEMNEEKYGHVLSIRIDGNGIMPPCPDEISKTLSEVGIWVSFQGEPGFWSCWLLHIPDEQDVMSVFALKHLTMSYLIPSRSIQVIETQSAALDPALSIIEFERNQSFKLIPLREKKQGFYLRIVSGLNKVYLFMPEKPLLEDVILKNLDIKMTIGEKFKYVGIEVQRDHETLRLVLNPHYLVFNHG